MLSSDDDKKSRRTRADTTLGSRSLKVRTPGEESAKKEVKTCERAFGTYPQLVKRVTDKCKCSMSQFLSKFPIGRTRNADFHASFTTCATCRNRGPEYLCLKCTKAFCAEHVGKHFNTNTDHSLYLFSELVRYEEAFFCFKCDSFVVVEPFDPYLDAMFGSKGSFVDIPVTHKHIEYFQSQGRQVGTATMQGWRSANEDAHCVSLGTKISKDIDFFGVFDGHGGPLVARYAATNLIDIFQEMVMKGGEVATDFSIALKDSFEECDAKLQCDGTLSLSEVGSCGSTANVVVLDHKKKIALCANAGDARAVLCRNGSAIPLSVDHRPSNPQERERILTAGSQVSEDDRVDGLLAVSRALGDFDFKQANSLPPERQAVTCTPDISITEMTPEDQFVLLACDGIWDVMSSQDVVTFLCDKLHKNSDPTAALEALLERCVAKDVTPDGLGTDNMSAVLVILE